VYKIHSAIFIKFINNLKFSTGNYVDYEIEGVMYDANTKYEGLITTIFSQLGVDTTIYQLELMYFVIGPSPPMKIHNDMGVYNSSLKQK